MPLKKNVFIQIEKFNWKNFALANEISKKVGNGLYILLINIQEEDRAYIEERISGFQFQYFESYDEARAFLNEFNPDIIFLTQQKLNPFEHIFRLTDAEKFLKGLNEFNTVLLWEDSEKIESILINIDLETFTEKFLDLSYKFASRITDNFKFIYSFYESFYEYRLMKTHTSDEAKQLLNEMLEEHTNKIKSLLNKVVGEDRYTLEIIKGDPKKEVPYYLRKNGYDMLIINKSIEDKESYIENTENSVGIFLD